MIPLSVPNIFENEKKYVIECLDSGWISSSGNFVNKFEDIIKNYVGSKYAIACMNGTVGLHISLLLSNIRANDLIIAPNLTFVATINAIAYTGASAVLFDIDKNTWQIDVDLVENWLNNYTKFESVNGKSVTIEKSSGKRISAIVPVHVLGKMCDVERLNYLCKKFNLIMIEDSTESLGSFYNKKHSGTFGKLGVFSFNGNKIISTGGGGMIVTDDKDLAIKAKHLTTTAKVDPLFYFHDEVGYNYRLVNILAAIGLGQMENFDSILKRKKEISSIYIDELSNVGDINFQKKIKNNDDNCWLFTFRTKKMKKLLNYLNDKGITSRPFWTPMNQLPMYSSLKYISEFDFSNRVFNDCISIPSSSNLTQSDQQKVIKEIKNFFNK